MPDDEAYLIKALISHFYGKLFDKVRPEGMSELMFFVEVYNISEKYDAKELKAASRIEVQRALPKAWSEDDPTNAAFWDPIAAIYSGTIDTDRGLRELAMRALANATSRPMGEESRAKMREVLATCPGLANDLALMQLETMLQTRAPYPGQFGDAPQFSVFSPPLVRRAPGNPRYTNFPGLGPTGDVPPPRQWPFNP